MRLAGPGLIVPPSCACCGEPAAGSDVVGSPGGTELFVGYCDDCLGHAGAERSKKLAGGVASLLLGLSLALALPLSTEPLPLPLASALSLAGAVVPLALLAFLPRTPGRGHSAVGPAVRFVGEGELLCANDRWAVELARQNGAVREPVPFHERRMSLVFLFPVLLAPALAFVVEHVASPILRVVNVSGEPISVEVDGRSAVKVESTSLESSSAGVELRVASGRHELVARGARGNVVERASVAVVAGRPHLFAPASAGHCFWLETRGYGRGDPGETTREPLVGPPYFWSLPAKLGGWFHPVPDAALAGDRLTGGSVTVLRQGPCDEPAGGV